MIKSEILRSSREREKKIKNTQRLFGTFIVVVLVGGFLFLLNLNFFRLTSFNILGQTSQDLSALKQMVRSELGGSYLWLVPRNSVFFFSKNNLATRLKQKFPGFQSVEIDSPNLNTLAINVADRDSKVLWCNSVATGKRCYYLNDEGLAYQTAPNFSDSIIMEFDSAGVIKKIPAQVISAQDLARAKLFLNFLKSTLTDWPASAVASAGKPPVSTYKLARINIFPMKDFEAIIVSQADPNISWKLLFNTGATSDQLITNFHSLIKDQTLMKDWTSGSAGSPQGKTLDYLDLRFDNKVFYKFK